MKRKLLALLVVSVWFVLSANPAAHLSSPAQAPPSGLETFHGCGMAGDAKGAGVKALNKLKNRYVAPGPSDIKSTITLDAILAPGNDAKRWAVTDAAEITGYVFDVKPGAVESVNCHAQDDADRDTHIEMVLDPMQKAGTKRMIVEVTPRWRAIMTAQGIDWSTSTLRDKFLGRWIKVRGRMLFDTEHKGESENTAPGRPRNWRATAWEIHPITAIEVLSRPQ